MQTTDNSKENVTDVTELTDEQIAKIAGGSSNSGRTPTCPNCRSTNYTVRVTPAAGGKIMLHVHCSDCGFSKTIGPITPASH